MDSNIPGFLLNSSEFHPYCSKTKEDSGIIDLGLSLRTLQPETYQPSGQMISLDGCGELIDWSQSSCGNSQPKSHEIGDRKLAQEDCDEEADGVESKGRWAYVKVNMDGVVVGRKVCILDHGGYTTLAHQLEDMFGTQTVSGLRLFQAGSEFSLLYKDKEGSWRNASDVPWKELVESVMRLRIAIRNDTRLPASWPFN